MQSKPNISLPVVLSEVMPLQDERAQLRQYVDDRFVVS